MWNAPGLKSQEWEMHISHMQCVQVYALGTFDAQPAWKLAIYSWDFASVLRALDVVMALAVGLHAIGLSLCAVHVDVKDVQDFLEGWTVNSAGPRRVGNCASAVTAGISLVGRSQSETGESSACSACGRAAKGGRARLKTISLYRTGDSTPASVFW